MSFASSVPSAAVELFSVVLTLPLYLLLEMLLLVKSVGVVAVAVSTKPVCREAT